MGTTGSVSYMFENLGVIIIERTVELDEDTMMEIALECGADDVIVLDDIYEVRTQPGDFSSVRKYLEEKGITIVKQSGYYFRKKAYQDYAEYKKIEFRY
jgi:transcriptional/translational regulatory protein YebC/TACO1